MSSSNTGVDHVTERIVLSLLWLLLLLWLSLVLEAQRTDARSEILRIVHGGGHWIGASATEGGSSCSVHHNTTMVRRMRQGVTVVLRVSMVMVVMMMVVMHVTLHVGRVHGVMQMRMIVHVMGHNMVHMKGR
jgi:hypothetical protein